MKREKKKSNFYYKAHFVVAGFFRFLFRARATGLENIPEGGCILCINHTQWMDPIVIGAVTRRQVHFMGKKELFKIPLIGALCRALGMISVDRGGADVSSVKRVISTCREGEIVGIFPQGHRFRGVNPADTPIRSGIGMMAHRAGVPVVPVCIKLHKQRYSIFHKTEVIFGQAMHYDQVIQAEEHNMGTFRQASRAFFGATCALGGYTPTDGEIVCK